MNLENNMQLQKSHPVLKSALITLIVKLCLASLFITRHRERSGGGGGGVGADPHPHHHSAQFMDITSTKYP